MSVNISDGINNSEHIERKNQISDSDSNNTPIDDGINFDIYANEDENIKRNNYKFHSSKIASKTNRPFNNEDEESKKKLKDIRKAFKKQTPDKQAKYNTKNELKIQRKNRISEIFARIKRNIWQGKRKVITLFILIIVIPSIIIIPHIIENIINAEAEKRFATEVAEGEQKALETLNTVNKKMFIDPNNYDLCEKIYIDSIDNAQSNTEKMFLSAYYALFLTDLSSDYEKAISILDNTDIKNTGINAKTTYYNAYIKIYDSEHMDNSDKYQHYIKLKEEL